jgi:hypothetical protein
MVRKSKRKPKSAAANKLIDEGCYEEIPGPLEEWEVPWEVPKADAANERVIWEDEFPSEPWPHEEKTPRWRITPHARGPRKTDPEKDAQTVAKYKASGESVRRFGRTNKGLKPRQKTEIERERGRTRRAIERNKQHSAK